MLNKGETNMTHNLSQQANDKIDTYLTDWFNAYVNQIVKTYNKIQEKDYFDQSADEKAWCRSHHSYLATEIIRARQGKFSTREFDNYEDYISSLKNRLVAEKKETLICRITKKGGNIKSVESLELVANNLEGIFETEKGNVHLRTIWAGGYHIQTLHVRMICTLK